MTEPEESQTIELLGDWIARWRAKVGVSQRTLAALAGIDQGGLSRVERGLQLIGGRRLVRVLITLDELGAGGPMGPITPPPFRPPLPGSPPSSSGASEPRPGPSRW